MAEMLIVGFALTTMTVLATAFWAFLIGALVTGAWPSDDCDPALIRRAVLIGSFLLIAGSIAHAWLRFGSAKRRAASLIPDDLFRPKFVVALLAPLVITTTAIIVAANALAGSNVCRN